MENVIIFIKIFLLKKKKNINKGNKNIILLISLDRFIKKFKKIDIKLNKNIP
jgi:hypothetical protein